MKWLLVLISLNLYDDGTADHFLFTNMKYISLKHCQETARINLESIQATAIREFNGPANLFCFREDKFKEYLNQTPPTKKLGI